MAEDWSSEHESGRRRGSPHAIRMLLDELKDPGKVDLIALQAIRHHQADFERSAEQPIDVRQAYQAAEAFVLRAPGYGELVQRAIELKLGLQLRADVIEKPRLELASRGMRIDDVD